MNLIEVAVYVMVLTSGSQPFTCTSHEGPVACSNGIGAALNGRDQIEFDNGVWVEKFPDGTLQFSNGVRSHWSSAGWVKFSSGLSVRRERDGSFKFSNRMVCRPDTPDDKGRERVRCGP